MRKIKVLFEPWSDGYAVYDWEDNGMEKMIIRYSVTTERLDPGSVGDAPSYVLEHDTAQRLMNALWESGLRPKDGTSSLAHVEAMQAHLEDLRKLVFKTDQ